MRFRCSSWWVAGCKSFALSKFWRKGSAEGPVALVQGLCHWRLAGRSPAVASDVHVDLHRDGSDLSRVRDFQRELPASFVYTPRPSRRLADGAPLLLFGTTTRGA